MSYNKIGNPGTAGNLGTISAPDGTTGGLGQPVTAIYANPPGLTTLNVTATGGYGGTGGDGYGNGQVEGAAGIGGAGGSATAGSSLTSTTDGVTLTSYTTAIGGAGGSAGRPAR